MPHTSRQLIPIAERNRQILQLRLDGVRRVDVARSSNLSPSRIQLIEKRDAADRLMALRRAKLRKDIRAADDLERMWPVDDLLDALGLTVVPKKRLLEHFVKTGKVQISLRELMNMCLDAPVEGLDFMMSPLHRVRGVGKIGFWSVVNGFTSINLGNRCNGEWRKRLAQVKHENQVTGTTPYADGHSALQQHSS